MPAACMQEKSRQRDERTRAVWLIVPIVGSLLVPRASVRFSPKYLIAITPVYYALMVLGLAALRKESRTLFWVVVALLICVSLYGLGEYYLRPHDKLALENHGATIEAHLFLPVSSPIPRVGLAISAGSSRDVKSPELAIDARPIVV